MISEDVRRQYTVTIGIECHVQLKTKTKLFSGADNDAREAAPNTLVNHIDFGLPGALPVLNEKAVDLASRAAFALGTKPQLFSKFDRKHYFYPDLPMGYQITQFDEPIILGGYVDVTVEGEHKRVGITRAHLEADAGKSTHPAGTHFSLVDLNRAGTPLLEIVSEPDMHSAAEAKAYAHELWLLMRYADVSYANLYYGNMRFDVNVSVSKDSTLGTRTETKNLNSFRSIERAVEYEVNRQIELLETGKTIVQETRGWDDAGQKTFSQRSKEDAHDYRYMPDPDVPPVVLTDEYVAQIAALMPDLPSDFRNKFANMGLDENTIEDVIADPKTARTVGEIFDEAGPEHAKRVAFWLMRPQSDDPDNVSEVEPTEENHESQVKNLIALSHMVADNKLSSTAAKEVLDEVLKNGENPEKVAEAKNLLQESDESAISAIVQQVVAANPKAATDVQRGEMKAIGFLVGQVMKQSKGKANPALATELIKKHLGI
ncbi:Asp-tRNA(Asn)/Glu-tRNA(Gln) amidotransferase subunit GatB [Candidatus Saccharibacteria bacterium]|nr:MAG: Asp-tRNA(Asn)/Glu-tRNA(Gln) amidotransferase subunit GatB [Candidatus Saccharibacteria bacterium]